MLKFKSRKTVVVVQVPKSTKIKTTIIDNHNKISIVALSPSLHVSNISNICSRVTSHTIIAKHKQKGWSQSNIIIWINNIKIHPNYFISFMLNLKSLLPQGFLSSSHYTNETTTPCIENNYIHGPKIFHTSTNLPAHGLTSTDLPTRSPTL